MKNKFNIRNRYVLIGDAILVILSVLSAYILRLELIEIFSNYYLSLLWMIGLSLLIKDHSLLFIWALPSYVDLCQYEGIEAGYSGCISRVGFGVRFNAGLI